MLLLQHNKIKWNITHKNKINKRQMTAETFYAILFLKKYLSLSN